jgi:hypothetical protein
MKPQDKRTLSSKQLLEKIGISNDQIGSSLDLLDEETDLGGDLTAALRERYHQLKGVRHALKPGMVVTWKPGLKNRRWPAYGQPGIVVALLDTPVFDTDEPGSTYFREALDMIIGVFLDSGEHRGEFLVFHTSSERYQPWPGEEE